MRPFSGRAKSAAPCPSRSRWHVFRWRGQAVRSSGQAKRTKSKSALHEALQLRPHRADSLSRQYRPRSKALLASLRFPPQLQCKNCRKSRIERRHRIRQRNPSPAWKFSSRSPASSQRGLHRGQSLLARRSSFSQTSGTDPPLAKRKPCLYAANIILQAACALAQSAAKTQASKEPPSKWASLMCMPTHHFCEVLPAIRLWNSASGASDLFWAWNAKKESNG